MVAEAACDDSAPLSLQTAEPSADERYRRLSTRRAARLDRIGATQEDFVDPKAIETRVGRVRNLTAHSGDLFSLAFGGPVAGSWRKGVERELLGGARASSYPEFGGVPRRVLGPYEIQSAQNGTQTGHESP